MENNIKKYLTNQLDSIKESGLYKSERILKTPQGAKIKVGENKEVLNMCANNYLGLSSHPDIIEAAHNGLNKWGYGLSSVRFICGTQEIHKELELTLSEFLKTEDTILYSSCFDANTGLFETILSEEDAIISDQLNHASIIDGVRLCKAKRYRFNNSDMNHLEEKLKEAKNERFRLIATDGVFSMDGSIAKLKDISFLANKYNSMIMVDDSHGIGVLGKEGRGSHEYMDVIKKIDIITGTLGKALGGASGGYTSGRKEVIDILRQRSRPYLFSNSLAPVIVETSLKSINIISSSSILRDKLMENTKYFREGLSTAGFDIKEGVHPIVPVMLGEAVVAQKMSEKLLERGIYVIGFFYPVVPHNTARIRVQISAAHKKEDLDFAIKMFSEVKRELNI
ncbi:glycine C-acetyltransferase [bacterium]|nr:glycine C-acetyltransferase [bacterium]